MPERELPKWKRTLDMVLLLLMAPAIALIFLVISAYIKLVSRGPVFFRQERVGYRGRAFKLYKFRSMHQNADAGVHRRHLAGLIQGNQPMQKLDTRGDKRLIPLGWILRASGLDELPQLINVMKGQMSIIGPRPSTRYELEMFQPWHRERLLALPGMTGLWQVSGKNKTTLEEMIQLDVFYARNQSFWLDVRILVRTLPALLEQVRDHLKGSALAKVTVAKEPERKGTVTISTT